MLWDALKGSKLKAMRRLIVFVFLAVLLNTPHLVGEDIILEHADSTRFEILEDSIITYLYGHVSFMQGNSRIQADSVIYSSNGYYRFCGGTQYDDSLRSLSTDLLEYNSLTDMFYSYGGANLIDMEEFVTVGGDSVWFDNTNQVLTVTGSPNIIFNNNDPTRMIYVDCDSLQYYSNKKYAETYGNVEITKGNLEALCGRAYLMPDSNQLILMDNPTAKQLDNSVAGDSMTVYLSDDLIDNIDVNENATALYTQKSSGEDSTYTESRLKAKNIQFQFDNEQLSRIISAGNSYSEYIPTANDTISSGRNIASGDSIKLHFLYRKLIEVEIITSCQGAYYSSAKIDSTGALIDEDTIKYSTDHLRYIIGDNTIRLHGNSEVKHETVTLDGDTILYNTGTKILQAKSYWSYGSEGDSSFHPIVLTDKAEIIYGERLSYNVATQRGKIKESDTEMEQAYYHGKIIRKQEEDILLVNGGRYTTCEYPEPHFQFYSSNMKLLNDDRVIARPVILYIDKIPIFYLPYFVFSIKKDRHSGFLPFQIGNFERGSRFVNNLGYYWALSDYYDLQTSIDYNDEVGVTFNAAVRYALRYKFSGSVSGSYARETSYNLAGQTSTNRWKLNLSHKHTLSQTASLNGTGNFVSDADYVTDISTDPEERLNRSLRSTLSFSKSWGRKSLTAVVKGTRNLDTDNTTYNLPDLSFSIPSRQIFAGDTKTEDLRWYQNLYLSYRAASTNYTSNTGKDSARTSRHYANMKHTFALSMPTTVMKYLTLSPSATINENWFYVFETDQSLEQGLNTNENLRRGDYSFGLSANTKLYGLFRPPIKGLIGLRHVITPSLSFSYRPKSDRHEDEASFAGIGTGGAESQTMRWSLDNLFQIKYKSGEQEKKLDLFTLGFSSSYNFKADSYKWSYLSTSLRSSTIPHLTFTASASHDLYDRDKQKLDIFGAKLKSLSLSSNFNIAGQMTTLGGHNQIDSSGAMFPSKGEKKPWSLSVGHRYSETRGDLSTSITHWLTISSEFSLTDNWKVSFSQNYDIRNKELTERSFSFYRDLHCWEAVFYWIPNGSRKGYYFRIGVKAIPDIKFEKSESGIRGALLDNF